MLAVLPLLSSLLLLSGSAHAQLTDNTSITLKETIRRKNFDAGREKTSINREDCNVDESIGLNLVMGEPDAQLEIWASTSTDCSKDDQRNSNDSLCWQVLAADPNSDVFYVRVQDILPHSGARAGGPGSGTESSCSQPSAGSVTLYIMLISGTNLNPENTQKVTFNHDLAGPKAARLNKASSAEGGLILEWDTSSSNDVLGYYLYCEDQDENPVQTSAGGTSSTGSGGTGSGGTTSGGSPTGGTAGSGAGAAGTESTSAGGAAGIDGTNGTNSGGTAGAAALSGGTAGSGGVSGGGGTAGTESGGTAGTDPLSGAGGLDAQQQQTDLGGGGGASGTAGTAGTAGSTETDGTSGTTSATEDPECRAAHLKAGQTPGADARQFRRATASQITTKAFAGGLQNKKPYACGIAAYDEEDNIGVLSNLKCGTPQNVRDYFEEYRDAGGEAGGGYCRFGRASAGSLGLIFGFAALALGLALRRSRSSQ